ncbi:cupin domain-containing protein [Streptomyces sp. NPDC088812]|uniref:cupin domain-containing protein n=1 Tax=Streptomyces sp. NPDC088812 TaxID=3365905 RepID=UPI00380AD5D5
MADGLLTERLALSVPERTRIVLARYEIPPGGELPWHYHEGRVVAVVTAGTLTRTLADGSECVTRTGEAIVEPVGPRGVHRAENRETGTLALCALFFLPVGSPLSTRAEAPVREGEGAGVPAGSDDGGSRRRPGADGFPGEPGRSPTVGRQWPIRPVGVEGG